MMEDITFGTPIEDALIGTENSSRRYGETPDGVNMNQAIPEISDVTVTDSSALTVTSNKHVTGHGTPFSPGSDQSRLYAESNDTVRDQILPGADIDVSSGLPVIVSVTYSDVDFITPRGSYGSINNGFRSPRTTSFSSCNDDDIDTENVINHIYGNHASYDVSCESTAGNESDKDTAHVYRGYPVRWYILTLFSLLAFHQSWGWNTYGPIATSAKVAYGWDNWMISLIATWGPVMFMLTVFFFSWMVETKGLRPSCLIAMLFITMGIGLRCVTQTPPYTTWLANVGQICISTAGPVAMAIASVISATWFPAGERTTATAIANRLMGLGGGFPFIIGPVLVRDVDNMTVDMNSSQFKHEVRHDIQTLMYIELGCSGVIFLIMLLYFPSKPPTPPSVSVAKRNVDFFQGLSLLIRMGNFWLLALPYSCTYGLYIGWIATFDINLQSFGISEMTAGLIGFVGCITSIIIGVAMARIVDKISGRTKPILLILFTVGAGTFLWFALLCDRIISYNQVSMYISRTLGATAMSAMVPLVFETLCETAYPVPESVTNGLLTFLKNFWCLVFLSVLWVPNVGTQWMNWVVVAAACVCIPMVMLFTEKHGRLDMDLAHSQSQTICNGDVTTGDTRVTRSDAINDGDSMDTDGESKSLLSNS